MKKVDIEKKRNIVLIGHGGSGKTSLIEAILYDTKMTDRLGQINEGNTVMDYDPEEIKKQNSISTSCGYAFYKDHKINLIDTPGFADFIGDVISSLRVADSTLTIVCGINGIEVGTERAWDLSINKPRVVFINKLDKEMSNFNKVYDQLKKQFREFSLAVFSIPIGSEADFKGVVDIVSNKAIMYSDTTGKFEVKEVPGDMKDEVNKIREELIEFVAELTDELTEKYLDEGTLSDKEFSKGLKEGIKSGKIIPVLAGSSTQNIGIHTLLDTINNYLPNPTEIPEITGINPKDDSEITREPKAEEPLCGYIFKTVSEPHVGEMYFIRIFSGHLKAASDFYNVNKQKSERTGQTMIALGKKRDDLDTLETGDIGVLVKLKDTETGDSITDANNQIQLPPVQYPDPIYSLALNPKSKQDQEKLSQSLTKLHKEDPSFSYRMDVEFSETIISGLGDMHLNAIIERLSRKFDVAITTSLPQVPYRETIKKTVKKQGKYKRQSGGRGQYGDVHVEIKPLPSGSGFEFIDGIVGGVVPKNYIPAVEKGIKGAMADGFLAGFPVVDMSAKLYDGSFHQVDSSDMAFQIAGSMAWKKCMEDAKPILLEPIYKVDIAVPEDYMGDIMGDLNSRRGKILGMSSKGKNQVISALVPLSEMFTYINDLKSMTGGRGSFTMIFEKYEEVPAHAAEKIIEARKKKDEEEKK